MRLPLWLNTAFIKVDLRSHHLRYPRYKCIEISLKKIKFPSFSKLLNGQEAVCVAVIVTKTETAFRNTTLNYTFNTHETSILMSPGFITSISKNQEILSKMSPTFDAGSLIVIRQPLLTLEVHNPRP